MVEKKHYHTCEFCGEEFEVWSQHSREQYCAPCKEKKIKAGQLKGSERAADNRRKARETPGA